MIAANALKSEEFKDNVGMQFLGNFTGTDTASPRTDSADAFVEAYTARFDGPPSGPGLANSYDATMIALLAMHAAGEGATGAQIAEKVGMITDPNGTLVTADADGFAQAKEVLSDGGTVSYQGATGNVQFDANGDVSAPAVMWTFGDSGIEEQKYISLTEVNDFMASMN